MYICDLIHRYFVIKWSGKDLFCGCLCNILFPVPPTRDIPMPLVSSGVEHGNLRELALTRMKDMGTEVRLTIKLKDWVSAPFQ